MNFEALYHHLAGLFGEEVILGRDEASSPKALLVEGSAIASVCNSLYENDQTFFDFLSCITAIDNGVEAATMELVYNLYSIPIDHALTLKVKLKRNKENEPLPVVPSVSQVWRSANWHEREAYDLLGIHFEGHPDLRRILMPADWEGHPLRKDYEVQKTYHGIKVEY